MMSLETSDVSGEKRCENIDIEDENARDVNIDNIEDENVQNVNTDSIEDEIVRGVNIDSIEDENVRYVNIDSIEDENVRGVNIDSIEHENVQDVNIAQENVRDVNIDSIEDEYVRDVYFDCIEDENRVRDVNIGNYLICVCCFAVALGLGCLTPLCYIVAVSFISGGNRNARKKPTHLSQVTSKLYHLNVVSSTPRPRGIRTHNFSADRHRLHR